MRGALLNPIRFYRADDMPDYLTIFPNFDNTTYGDAYFYGIAASPDCIRNHVGDMFLQFIVDDASVFTFDVYKINDENEFENISSVSSVDISPVGWVTEQIHKVTLTAFDDGIYQLKNNDYTSDIFRITSSTTITEDLVKIQYSNTRNEFGCIFGANYFTAYFRGNIEPGDSDINKESFPRDDGGDVELRSTPNRTATLNIMGVHQNYKSLIEMISSCNDKTINGVKYSTGSPSYEQTKGSDIANITIKLVQTNNDYYHA